MYDGTWNELALLRDNVDQENTWHNETVDLSPYLTDSFQIRFRAKVSSSREDANVDNVRIVASRTHPASAMATDLALAAWAASDSSDDDDSDILTQSLAENLVLMLVE